MSDTLRALKLNARMRDTLAIERDSLIFQAKSDGLPVTQIAEAIGLERTQVHRILRDSWLVAELGTGTVMGWYRSEEAAEAARGADPTLYSREVQVEADGSWL
ncbi:MAG: helix-turn-helix domain-containing protein [Pseudolysinimonas sp.]